ncbi:hypothetical protein ADK60_14060 [Streptomyces sp. XY431]|uniref:hypothetical protein n=1 Tax=Streptomyces sp. XY431 TaxID=1415562 RepID=UPI0006B0005D|nr:hypothetical protein [Streptomyces sp. XY431]KOV32373.1 hypothetical protein ADK60_14060 [Streptomyces sp. XY431]
MSSQHPTTNTSSQARGLWVLVAALVSLIIGIVVGILTSVDGMSVVGAILCGGTAFGGSMTLALLVLAALRVL